MHDAVDMQTSPAAASWKSLRACIATKPGGRLKAGAGRRTLVHTQLSSSAAYWGAGSLDEDAEELNLLALYLKQHHSSVVRARHPVPTAPQTTWTTLKC